MTAAGRRPRARRAVGAAALLLVAGLARGAGAAPVPAYVLAARLPASTLAYVRVARPGDVAAAVAGAALGGLAPDEGRAVVDAAAAALARAAGADDPATAGPALTRAARALADATGPVEAALVAGDPDGGFTWAVAVDLGPGAARATATLTAVAPALAAAAVLDADGAGASWADRAGAGGTARARLVGTTLVATNAPAAEALFAAGPAAGGSLADTSAWRGTVGAAAPETLVVALGDPGAIADALVALAPGVPARRVADAFGLAGVVVARYDLAVADGDLVERLAVQTAGPDARLPALLAGGGDPARLRPFAPRDAVATLGVGLPIAALPARVARVRAVVEDEPPSDAAHPVEAAAAAVLAAAGDAALLWAEPGPDGPAPALGGAVALADPAAAGAALARLAAALVAAAAADGARLESFTETTAGVAIGGVRVPAGRGGAAGGGVAWGLEGAVLVVAPTPASVVAALARGRATAPPRPAGPPGTVLVLDAAGSAAFLPGADLPGVPRWPPAVAADAGPLAAAAARWRGRRSVVRLVAEADGTVTVGARGPGPLLLPTLATGLAAALAGSGRAEPASPTGPALSTSRADLGPDAEHVTDAALARVAAALAFRLRLLGRLPPTLAALVADPSLLPRVPPDGWGRPLRWTVAADRSRGVLTSAGPDGTDGTDDDRRVEVPAAAK